MAVDGQLMSWFPSSTVGQGAHERSGSEMWPFWSETTPLYTSLTKSVTRVCVCVCVSVYLDTLDRCFISEKNTTFCCVIFLIFFVIFFKVGVSCL